MHRPGHVQGGQEAKRGYLLLGVYHRRIPGFTVVLFIYTYFVYLTFRLVATCVFKKFFLQ
jgi:hypothetical protein